MNGCPSCGKSHGVCEKFIRVRDHSRIRADESMRDVEILYVCKCGTIWCPQNPVWPGYIWYPRETWSSSSNPQGDAEFYSEEPMT